MKYLVLVICMLGFHGAMAVPLWDGTDRKKMIAEGWLAGQDLLDFTTIPEYEIMVHVEPTAEEAALDLVAVEYVPEAHIDAYFAGKPDKFLVDPQGLMPRKEWDNLGRFLQLHAEDSEIDLHVYVFGEYQSIPTDVRVQEVPERLFSGVKPAILVFYHLGAPARALVYLSPNMTDVVSIAEQRRAAESALVKATQEMGMYEQMEEFLVQISVRAYWMERMLAGTASETMDKKPASEVKVAEIKGAGKKGWRLPLCLRDVKAYGIAGVAGLLILVFGFVWLRSRRRYTFPEVPVEARLGGEHAAGVGAIMSFTTSKHSLSEQRDQIFKMWD
jgi:hypothetical protein